MSDDEVTFEALKNRLAEFNRKRDWDRFHNPKDLAVSISIESGELLENFQWQPAREPGELKADGEAFDRVKDEMADLLIYLFILANRLDIDISDAMSEKIKRNESRFECEES